MTTLRIFIRPIIDVDQGDQSLLKVVVVKGINIHYRHFCIYIVDYQQIQIRNMKILLQDDSLFDDKNRDSVMTSEEEIISTHRSV